MTGRAPSVVFIVRLIDASGHVSFSSGHVAIGFPSAGFWRDGSLCKQLIPLITIALDTWASRVMFSNVLVLSSWQSMGSCLIYLTQIQNAEHNGNHYSDVKQVETVRCQPVLRSTYIDQH